MVKCIARNVCSWFDTHQKCYGEVYGSERLQLIWHTPKMLWWIVSLGTFAVDLTYTKKWDNEVSRLVIFQLIWHTPKMLWWGVSLGTFAVDLTHTKNVMVKCIARNVCSWFDTHQKCYGEVYRSERLQLIWHTPKMLCWSVSLGTFAVDLTHTKNVMVKCMARNVCSWFDTHQKCYGEVYRSERLQLIWHTPKMLWGSVSLRKFAVDLTHTKNAMVKCLLINNWSWIH